MYISFVLELMLVCQYWEFIYMYKYHYNDHIFSFASRPPVTRYRSMYLNLSTGLVWPFVISVDCCELVRLYTLKKGSQRLNIIRCMGERYLNAIFASGSNDLSRIKL